ncbi:MAG: S1 RNA-binding domain-containing protein [Candidatus Paraimprobicoccus trichonymphae]|uniref:S1 RNA-binding domain-containing protein n=1 Tax=Candidatus Paraimprobicoccus trichonymphae TaxID=3033793 RepID=A0AA48HVT5_9FIRM|nr:MAG: S1 RNA-binding domain-containing protein [Candidatus Paraimprobicoccus trichonymphae]
MLEFYPEGQLVKTEENKKILSSPLSILEAFNNKKILEAQAIMCDSEHNLIVNLGCMKGKIPRLEGDLGIEDGSVRDIAVISKVNKPVCFVIKKLKENLAILSRKKAQEICRENYILKLTPGDIIPAKVTHLEPFGVFLDIGCGIISFLPIDSISISRISHPKERFSIGMDIKVIVKSIENSRVNLTHKELLGTWEENSDLFSIGETVPGIIRSVEEYGAFIELTPNLAGLSEIKENIYPSQQVSVYIKNIIPEKMKIKLVIIDTFESKPIVSVPKYFYQKNNIKKFVYSPKYSNKLIQTEFYP